MAKRIIKSAALLLVAALLLCSCGSVSVHVENPAVLGYESLSDREKVLYDDMRETVFSHEEMIISVGMKLSEQRLTEIHNMLMYDHPEIFWCDGFSYSKIGDACVLYSPMYGVEPEQAHAELERAVNAADVIAGLASVFSTEYDRAVFVHDYLARSNEYAQQPDAENGVFDIRGALLNGSCVCSGYARAFQLVAHRLGIECYYVSGEADGVGHAWNIAKLDGSFTLIDITYDDPVVSADSGEDMPSYGYISHAYFGVDAAELTSQRTRDNAYPYPDTVENSYLERAGLSGGSLADFSGAVAQSGAANVQAGSYFFEFKSDDVKSDAENVALIIGIIEEINRSLGSDECNAESYQYSLNQITGTACIYLTPVN